MRVILPKNEFIISFYLVFFITVTLFFPSACFSEEKPQTNTNDDESADPQLYPGKIQNDENGNMVKRWSTKGPVPVTQLNNQNPTSLPAGTFINVTPNIANPQPAARSNQNIKSQ